ncbi:MAG: hypothetical protein Ct9H300mP1_32720 [Planctomycetaceae bacterium]|nr:MAG: hypothetical protein Ct9H300mP1_32720 [Planctomycetaceae bacterium]
MCSGCSACRTVTRRRSENWSNRSAKDLFTFFPSRRWPGRSRRSGAGSFPADYPGTRVLSPDREVLHLAVPHRQQPGLQRPSTLGRRKEVTISATIWVRWVRGRPSNSRRPVLAAALRQFVTREMRTRSRKPSNLSTTPTTGRPVAQVRRHELRGHRAVDGPDAAGGQEPLSRARENLKIHLKKYVAN